MPKVLEHLKLTYTRLLLEIPSTNVIASTVSKVKGGETLMTVHLTLVIMMGDGMLPSELLAAGKDAFLGPITLPLMPIMARCEGWQ